MADPKQETERTGWGGSSDGDTQPDDAGATGTLADSDKVDRDGLSNRTDSHRPEGGSRR